MKCKSINQFQNFYTTKTTVIMKLVVHNK